MSRADTIRRLAAASAAREQAGLRRRLHTVEQAHGPHLHRDGRELLAFCSNDYLGLAQHPTLIEALRKAAAEHGMGGTAAHLICGHHREHAALEEALAAWTGRERALLFSTGIMANLGVMQALLERGDLCVQDRLNHASLIDGARASGCTLRRYPHADVDAAARQLQTSPEAAALLATDGVFSMDGDVAPLAELAALCRREGATLMVDDAHGLGVLGPRGAGSLAAAGLDADDAPVLMATLGKALGCAGAFVAGSAELIDGLVQFARSYIYTTAMPPALAAATRAAVELAQTADDCREHLAALIARFRHGATQLGLPLMDSPTPIQPLLLGDPVRATTAAEALLERGLLVTAIRPPTVPQGQARLRITLSAAHTGSDVDRLLDALSGLPPLQ
jgi:8-amino-7-oxononanoate synthase